MISYPDAPYRPDNFRVTAVGSNWVHLLWDCSSYTADSAYLFRRYDIFVIDCQNGTVFTLPFAPASYDVCSYNVTGLQDETLYEFTVAAVSEMCEVFARSQNSDLARSITAAKGKFHTLKQYTVAAELNCPITEPHTIHAHDV